MDVLISIKPKYVKKILDGDKKFEYRKSIFKRKVEKIYIYSSLPEQKIVGYFIYDGYKSGSPNQLWEETRKRSGVTHFEFKAYFAKKNIGYALKIANIFVYECSINPYATNKKFRPPQSFKYLKTGKL